MWAFLVYVTLHYAYIASTYSGEERPQTVGEDKIQYDQNENADDLIGTPNYGRTPADRQMKFGIVLKGVRSKQPINCYSKVLLSATVWPQSEVQILRRQVGAV